MTLKQLVTVEVVVQRWKTKKHMMLYVISQIFHRNTICCQETRKIPPLTLHFMLFYPGIKIVILLFHEQQGMLLVLTLLCTSTCTSALLQTIIIILM